MKKKALFQNIAFVTVVCIATVSSGCSQKSSVATFSARHKPFSSWVYTLKFSQNDDKIASIGLDINNRNSLAISNIKETSLIQDKLYVFSKYIRGNQAKGAVTISSDHKIFAEGIYKGGNSYVILYEVNSKKVIQKLRVPHSVYILCMSPKNQHLSYSSPGDYGTSRWCVFVRNNKGRYVEVKCNEKRIDSQDSYISQFAYSKDEKLFLTGMSNGTVDVWDTKHFNKISSYKVSSNPELNGNEVIGIEVSDSKKYIAILNSKGEVKIWNYKTGDIVRIKEISMVTSIVFFKDEGHVAIGKSNGEIVIYNFINKSSNIKKTHNSFISALCLSHDEKKLAVGYKDGSIKLVDIR